MASRFRHAALVGKYQAHGIRPVLEEIAHFLVRQGMEVSLEKQTAQSTGITGYGAFTPDELGRHCDIAVVVGGDGTMLGVARELARHGTPLVGINQGRLGFITDIRFDQYPEVLAPILRGEFEEDHRSLMHARVWRDGLCVMDALAMNDVVVNRGGTSGMVELRVEVGGHFVANQRADGLMVRSHEWDSQEALGVKHGVEEGIGAPCPKGILNHLRLPGTDYPHGD